jgi:hypothetical protein
MKYIVLMALFLGLFQASFGIEVVNSKGEVLATNISPELSLEKISNLFPNVEVYIKRVEAKTKINVPTKSFHLEVPALENSNYLLVNKAEVFQVCKDFSSEGVWDSEIPILEFHENCFYLKAPNFSKSLKISFLSSDQQLYSWIVLVNQSYVDLSEQHLYNPIWQADTNFKKKLPLGLVGPGEYLWEHVPLSKKLIVDKTEFVFEEADSILKALNLPQPNYIWNYYRDHNSNGHIKRPYIYLYMEEIANYRSKMEGLDSVYIRNPADDHSSACYLKYSGASHFVDTCANGYRLPYKMEWMALARGGVEKTELFSWGNSTDSETVSEYEWVNQFDSTRTVGLLKANKYGLYDVIGNAVERVMNFDSTRVFVRDECYSDEWRFHCDLLNDILPISAIKSGVERAYNNDGELISEKPIFGKKRNLGFRLVREVK